MSQVILYIPVEQYLRQWVIASNGGSSPVKLKKGSPEAHFLEISLQNKTQSSGLLDYKHDALCILIPEFRHKPAQYYNYLSPTAVSAFIKILRRRFDYAIWKDLMNLTSFLRRQDEVVYAWMEANGIDVTETNYLAVTKRLQRLRDRLAASRRMKNQRKSS